MALPRQMPSASFFRPVTWVKPPFSIRRRASPIVKLLRPFTGAAPVLLFALLVVTAGGVGELLLDGFNCAGVFVVTPGTVRPVVPVVPIVVPVVPVAVVPVPVVPPIVVPGAVVPGDAGVLGAGCASAPPQTSAAARPSFNAFMFRVSSVDDGCPTPVASQWLRWPCKTWNYARPTAAGLLPRREPTPRGPNTASRAAPPNADPATAVPACAPARLRPACLHHSGRDQGSRLRASRPRPAPPLSAPPGSGPGAPAPLPRTASAAPPPAAPANAPPTMPCAR